MFEMSNIKGAANSEICAEFLKVHFLSDFFQIGILVSPIG